MESASVWFLYIHPRAQLTPHILVVTDYGDENPLLYDYFGFQPSLYKLKFNSRGDSAISQRIIQLFKEVRGALRVPLHCILTGIVGRLSRPYNFRERITR